MKKGNLALFVLTAMLLGVAAGWASHTFMSAGQLTTAVMVYGLLTKIFITLIKMIIAPLVLFTLIAGIGHMEDAATVGRVGGKALGWFLLMSIISLVIGILMVEWLKPGVGMDLHVAGDVSVPSMAGFTLDTFIEHLIPSSIIKAMADNEILQIVVFAVFVGTAISMLEKKSPRVMELAEEASAIMLKVTSLVMMFAPFAIFGALARTVAEQGLPILITYAKFMGEFYAAMGILWALLIALGFVFIGKRMLKLLGVIREPALLAFSTASSEAAYPKLLAGLPTVGIPRKIVAFVLPLGYSFNLDGSMIYCTFATLFIAQAYGIHFTTPQLLMMLFLLLITSKGIAGVPRASLVVIMATLTYFGLPAEWIALVIGVDHLLDMGRSATNVLGNSVASAVIARWEGKLEEEA
ncbi:dicarboxylate/amino acid:cation symporter [Asticcacaulis sp. EMRT-3]|uniref:dicarboxylate/amino acid:cation symporter n=1 Tax=Asticcacaulis sp. EMRT-3 TaxID=3040349 RepID=UPI0024AEB33E|nr:dicarboxylate/amino acid:cation symporter [Asticcacaulis sp. EMRT-3]MDI7774634.1 dicarboxylate/amino acid:cation symporter [Asticcacaulis sp. EMRT-3]